VNAASYAQAHQLRQLGDFIDALTGATSATGWRLSSMVVTCGDVPAEEIVVGVRWSDGINAYVAEIR
jgi:hypothetical protein